MHRNDFIKKFQNSGEATTDAFTRLGEAVAGGTVEDIAGAIVDAALLEFSRDSQRISALTGTWDGATVVTLTNWYAQSQLLGVESPTGNHPPTLLTASQYDLDRDAGTLYFIGVSTGATYKARYTSLHTVPAMPADGSGTAPADVSIPDSLHQIFFTLCAAILFDRLAGRFAATTGSSFPADSVDHRTVSDVYRSLAKDARKRYRAALGLTEEYQVAPAGFMVELDTPDYRIMPEASA